MVLSKVIFHRFWRRYADGFRFTFLEGKTGRAQDLLPGIAVPPVLFSRLGEEYWWVVGEDVVVVSDRGKVKKMKLKQVKQVDWDWTDGQQVQFGAVERRGKVARLVVRGCLRTRQVELLVEANAYQAVMDALYFIQFTWPRVNQGPTGSGERAGEGQH